MREYAGAARTVVAPEAAHHLLDVDAKLLRVHARELGERERPAVEAGREGDGALGRVDLHVAELLVVVGRDEDVDVLDVLGEGHEHVLRRQLQLEEGAVELVDRDDRLDALAERLAQHRLGLHAHALDAVDDDERTVGDAQSGGDLGREVNVAGRVCKPEGSATQALAAYRGGVPKPVRRAGRGPRALRR